MLTCYKQTLNNYPINTFWAVFMTRLWMYCALLKWENDKMLMRRCWQRGIFGSVTINYLLLCYATMTSFHQKLAFNWLKPKWNNCCSTVHDDVIKWKHFPRHWPFVRRIHRSPVNSPHKGQWRGTLMFSLIGTWIHGCVNRKAGDLRRHRAHYDVTVMFREQDHHRFG